MYFKDTLYIIFSQLFHEKRVKQIYSNFMAKSKHVHVHVDCHWMSFLICYGGKYALIGNPRSVWTEQYTNTLISSFSTLSIQFLYTMFIIEWIVHNRTQINFMCAIKQKNNFQSSSLFQLTQILQEFISTFGFMFVFMFVSVLGRKLAFSNSSHHS